jgi:hypothetical protein
MLYPYLFCKLFKFFHFEGKPKPSKGGILIKVNKKFKEKKKKRNPKKQKKKNFK